MIRRNGVAGAQALAPRVAALLALSASLTLPSLADASAGHATLLRVRGDVRANLATGRRLKAGERVTASIRVWLGRGAELGALFGGAYVQHRGPGTFALCPDLASAQARQRTVQRRLRALRASLQALRQRESRRAGISYLMTPRHVLRDRQRAWRLASQVRELEQQESAASRTVAQLVAHRRRAPSGLAARHERSGQRPIRVSADAYAFQAGWDTQARTFIGLGQLALHENHARNFIGVVQLGFFGSHAGGFGGLLQIGPLNRVGTFVGLAQIGGWNRQDRAFYGLGQIGIHNESRREFLAAFQLGGYNRAYGSFCGAFQLGVINQLGHRDVLGPSQFGLLNIVDRDIYSALGQFGLLNIVQRAFYGPFQLGGYNSADLFRGAAQIGALNYVGDESYGAQIGVVNLARAIHGVQLGLFNYARKLRGLQLGLVNMSRQGGLPFMLLANAGF